MPFSPKYTASVPFFIQRKDKKSIFFLFFFLIFFQFLFFFFRHIMISISSIFSLFTFFLLQINFCIYLLIAFLIFLYHFHNSLLLNLVSHLCFFIFLIISCITHLLYIIKNKTKKLQNTSFIIQTRIIHYVYRIIFAHVPKVNSLITSFKRNNSNIIKMYSFCIKS